MGDVERCHYYVIDRDLYLFVWREKIIPTLGVVMLDLHALKTTGKIFGYKDNAMTAVSNFPIGAVTTIIDPHAGRMSMPEQQPSTAPASPPTSQLLLTAVHVAMKIDDFEILRDITFEAKRGEFLSVVGPSGCGKTTLLMCLAGLISRSGGDIVFNEASVKGPPPGLSVVFQDYSRSLMPWKRVVDNVVFGMKRETGLSASEKRDRAQELIMAIGLGGFEQYYPWQLSGGMQQRVAIARGLASRPKMLLLDEPLAAVDAQTRADMQDLLIQLSRTYQQSCILITHDVDEAIYVADRVIVLSTRPTMVVRDITIELPRDRDQIVTKSAPEFLKRREEILNLIRSMRAAQT